VSPLSPKDERRCPETIALEITWPKMEASLTPNQIASMMVLFSGVSVNLLKLSIGCE